MLLMKKSNRRVYVGIDESDMILPESEINSLYSGSTKKVVIIINSVSLEDNKRIVAFYKMLKGFSDIVKVSVVVIDHDVSVSTYNRAISSFYEYNGMYTYVTKKYRVTTDNGYIYEIKRPSMTPFGLFITTIDPNGFEIENRTLYQKGFDFMRNKFKVNKKKLIELDNDFKVSTDIIQHGSVLYKYTDIPEYEFSVYQKIVAEKLLEEYL